MNRAQLLLSVLRDGRPHSREEIFGQVGFMLLNNSAAELRAQGHNVLCERAGDTYNYRLLSERDGVCLLPASGISSPSHVGASRSESSLSKIDAAACADGSPEGDISPAASMYPLPEWSGGAALTVPPDQQTLWDAA